MNRILSLVGYLFKSNVYSHQNICFFNLIKFKQLEVVEFCDVCECTPCDCSWGS